MAHHLNSMAIRDSFCHPSILGGIQVQSILRLMLIRLERRLISRQILLDVFIRVLLSVANSNHFRLLLYHTEEVKTDEIRGAKLFRVGPPISIEKPQGAEEAHSHDIRYDRDILCSLDALCYSCSHENAKRDDIVESGMGKCLPREVHNHCQSPSV